MASHCQIPATCDFGSATDNVLTYLRAQARLIPSYTQAVLTVPGAITHCVSTLMSQRAVPGGCRNASTVLVGKEVLGTQGSETKRELGFAHRCTVPPCTTWRRGAKDAEFQDEMQHVFHIRDWIRRSGMRAGRWRVATPPLHRYCADCSQLSLSLSEVD